VVVTSYALLRRDASLLSRVDWDVVVFDEAQQVKNAASRGARAARDLPAEVKVAMTGTPVENRLAELWAMLDLTNPGIVGSQRRFAAQYARPIERWQDRDAAERLRRLTAPFILRRTKADPEVAADLPPKTIVSVACSLTVEQAALYQDALDRAFEAGLGTNPFERRGRILALLTALKQICNHPVQYRGDGGSLVGRSGKLARATEILGEIVDAGDHALVFTQFVAMGNLLVSHLAEQLPVPEVPFLHGSVPLAKREAMVNRFQDDPDAPPIMLVSLRAGGTGLTLHRATHVMHYDQWWNPAVEDQATDRAHRIGQTRPVTVHRLVTGGTVEERIDALLEHKRAIADAVLGTGEQWLSDLGDDELRDLVRLSRDDVEDEELAA
jgi:SNF2 family DNA or RNA helicase